MMDEAIIYFNQSTREIVRTDPPELWSHIQRVSGAHLWVIPTIQNLVTGQLVSIQLKRVDGEYRSGK